MAGWVGGWLGGWLVGKSDFNAISLRKTCFLVCRERPLFSQGGLDYVHFKLIIHSTTRAE